MNLTKDEAEKFKDIRREYWLENHMSENFDKFIDSHVQPERPDPLYKKGQKVVWKAGLGDTKLHIIESWDWVNSLHFTGWKYILDNRDQPYEYSIERYVPKFEVDDYALLPASSGKVGVYRIKEVGGNILSFYDFPFKYYAQDCTKAHVTFE